MKEKTSNDVVYNLIARDDYLVVQANDLAKAFGNLKPFELKVLDYCFSMVQKDSNVNITFTTYTRNILDFFQLSTSGENYKRVAESFKALNENTALYIPKKTEDGENYIQMTNLFEYINIYQHGKIEFVFAQKVAPYVFELTKNYYSFHLRDIAAIKGKYASILLKLWGSYRFRNNKLTVISGTLDEWQNWFIGKDRTTSAAEFKRSVLSKAIQQLEEKIDCDITLITKKEGRTVIGYEMEIIDNRIPQSIT
ncbi:replication initiation protein [Streptococcus uberis]|uniref:replication initiation protein n=1 Tax=Streptococcus uberis TaxID=1349 RepID=UPI0012B57E51|nr:replication initiation protein [Streptococcus uberis]MTB54036.1 RepB family plasmid replication initiator protein [Streptococcus uberis]MTB60121.1 RepB family plasmid replication initiator protein [Streptococcus uberis]